MKNVRQLNPTDASTQNAPGLHTDESTKEQHPPLVFVVEREGTTASSLSRALEETGFIVRTLDEGASVLPAAIDQTPALIILDIMPRGSDDVGLLNALNAQACLRDTGKIVLSASSAEKDKVQALESGADDYITKPFSTREVVARVRAVLRSRRMPSPSNRILRVGSLSADLDARRAWAAERELSLTATEFNLLVHFLRYPDQIVRRKTLQSRLWQKEDGRRVVDVYIYRLRQKIEVDPAAPLQLITCRNDGYMLLGSHGHSTSSRASESE
jgi:DNA-binding response OmpR family regulator